MDLKRIILEACVLVPFGALFGLMMNHQLVMDAFSGQLASPRDNQTEQIESLLPMPALLEDVQQVFAGGGVIIDARSTELFTSGHIAGAVSFPLGEFENLAADFFVNTPKDITIIVYCSGFGCPDSFDLGVLLIEAGYSDVRVFEGGFPEWRDAGLPVAGNSQ